MRTTTLLGKAMLLSLTLLLAISCNNNSRPKKELKSKLIETSLLKTTIQSDDPLIITFSEKPELFNSLTREEKNRVIEFNPEVKGNLYRTGDKQFVFQPEKPFHYGTTYKITLHLDKMFNQPADKLFTYEFKVYPLSMQIIFNNLSPVSGKTDNLVRLTGKILTSNIISTDEVAKAVSAKIGNNKLPVTVQQGDNDKTFNWSIDSIKRENKPGKLIFTLNQKLFGANENQTITYDIPPANRFSFVDFKVETNPEPHVVLTFSDFLSGSQNLDGLIRFEDGTALKYIVKNNQVLVYPVKELTETHSLIISQNIKNARGTRLDKQYIIKPVFKTAEPQVRFLGNGNILAGKEKWLIPFETINLKAVDVVVFKIYSNNIRQFLQNNELGGYDWALNRVGEYVYHEKIILDAAVTKPDNKWKSKAIDITKMVNTEPGAIYRIGFRFKKSYALVSCSSTNEQAVEQDNDSTAYLYSEYYYPRGYSWSKRDDPCDVSFYNYRKFAAKNFIAENIGLTVKSSHENHYRVFARNLLTTDILKNATIQFFTYQNQLIGETHTNSNGEADMVLKKEPFFVVAQWNKQFAYLRLKGGSSLSYSRFNTDGTGVEKGIKGYLFGERGVWRPGDTLFLTFVLQDKEKVLPAGHPVSIEVKDARDKKVYSEVSTRGINGFYLFKVPTGQDDPTGIWHAKVTIGNSTFTKNLRVETILPNRLKINLTADNDKFTAGFKEYLTLEAHWLHGGKASNLKASVIESINKAKTVFENFKDFTFDDPAKTFYPDEKSVFDGKLDNNGKASFEVILPEGKNLPGMLNLNFVAKVFEAGGRFSIDQKSYQYTPFNRYVGIKAPDKKNNYYYETDKEQQFTVVTLDNDGNKISVNGLKVEVFKLDWSWWYSSNRDNLAGYINQHYFSRIFSKTINTRNGNGTFSFSVKYPNWGRYYVRVTDTKGGHSGGMIIYFDWPSYYSRENRNTPGDATLLSLSADKNHYTIGEKATISFPAPANSKALISIEKNNRIIKSWWMSTKAGENSFKLDISPDMAPNVYAFVSVIQPHAQTVNDLPIRSYGVIPVNVHDPATVLKPVLSVPEKIKPESDYTIKVSEAGHRKMTYVLAVVDEGLLDLTHFKTPSLHDFFYKKEALAVRTWDLYNEVNGAFGGRLSQVFAIGGDDEITEPVSNKKEINRFKPVVTFLGPFTLEKGSNGNSHKLFMPNYIGSIRVMVMAGYEGAYGKAEKTVPVKQPLMVIASMPRKLVPGETLHLPVTVFAMEETIKKVTLSATGNDLFTIQNSRQTILFDSPGEKIAYLNIKVNNLTGEGKVRLQVTSRNESAFYDVNISIRNPNQRQYLTKSYPLEKGKQIKVMPEFLSNASEYKLQASVSSIPPVNLEQRINYLIRYPYGCIEQTTSSAFPQLFLSKLTRLTDEQKEEINQNISNTINRLGFFQTGSGGFSYWPGSNHVTEWGTSYAGHFLLLAKENGYYVPSDMLNNWISYQQAASSRWNENRQYYLQQSYRLYTLALAGKPNISAMNRLRENSNLTNQAKLRLAAAYALINEKNIAIELVENLPVTEDEDKETWRYTYGSRIRNEAFALETRILLDENEKAFKLFKNIASRLGSNEWMSTQTTAFALYAVSLFTDSHEQKDFTFDLKFDNINKQVNSSKPVYTIDLPPVKNKPVRVTNNSDQRLFLTIESSALPNPGETINKSEGLKLKINYFDMNGNNLDVTSLPQGKDFYVKIKVINESFISRDNLALSAIFPSGWEILNSRMTGIGNNLPSSVADYTDIRDDRVNLFFDLTQHSSKTFYILLNAAYPGKYFQSPVTAKAMYDNSIGASVGGGMVEVTMVQ